MNVLRARPSVRFEVIAPAGFRILSALDQTAQDLRVNLMITSGTDSHATGAHLTGEAFDVSVHLLSAQQVWDVKSSLEELLGPLFTVLYEVPKVPSDPTLRSIAYVNVTATGPHFHIQRKKHTTFPPAPVTPGAPQVA